MYSSYRFNSTMRLLFSLIILTASASFSLAQKSAPDSQQMRFEAMLKGDTVVLDKVLSEELTYLHSNGLFENKRDFIRNISSKKLVYENIKLEKMQIRRTGRISIIQGTGRFKGVIRGNPFEVKLHYISIYKKTNMRWKLIAWQSLKADA